MPPQNLSSSAPTLSASDMRTLGLAALGGALEFYDFIIFIYFTKEISQLFFPADAPFWLRDIQTYAIFAAGYLARPLGGLIMGHFGDRLGRKRMFNFSIFLMTLPTLCIGLLPTYADWGVAAPLVLLMLRILQGMAVGGEVPGAWVFVAEHAPSGRAGFFTGVLTAGISAGILLGAGVSMSLRTHFSSEEMLTLGWRTAFILGGVFGFLSLYMRRWLQETPVFHQMLARKKQNTPPPLLEIFRSSKKPIAFCMGFTLLHASMIVVILLTPGILGQHFHVPSTDALAGNIWATLGLTVGSIFFGVLVDAWGLRRTLIMGSLTFSGATLLFFQNLPAAPLPFTALYALAGFMAGIIGAVPALMVSTFEPRIRYSGVALSYNVAYAIVGGLTPVFVAAGIHEWSVQFPSYYVTFCCLLVAGLALFIAPGAVPNLQDTSHH